MPKRNYQQHEEANITSRYSQKQVFNNLLRPTLQPELHTITVMNKQITRTTTSSTFIIWIRPRALAMLISVVKALHGGHLPIHLDLEAIIHRCEDEHVISFKSSLTDELTPALDEADSLTLPRSYNLYSQ
jgi:hypothetical protein